MEQNGSVSLRVYEDLIVEYFLNKLLTIRPSMYPYSSWNLAFCAKDCSRCRLESLVFVKINAICNALMLKIGYVQRMGVRAYSLPLPKITPSTDYFRSLKRG